MSKRGKQDRTAPEAIVDRKLLLDLLERATKSSQKCDGEECDESEEYRRGRAIIDWLLFKEFYCDDPVMNLFEAVIFARNFGHETPDWAVDELTEVSRKLSLDPTISLDEAFGRKVPKGPAAIGVRNRKKLALEVWMYITMYEQRANTETKSKMIDAVAAAEDEFGLNAKTIKKHFISIEERINGEVLDRIVLRLSKYPDIFNPN